MVAQAIVQTRGGCVMEPSRAVWQCGGCGAVQPVARNKGRDQIDTWFALRERHSWRFTAAYGPSCARCTDRVAPWALESGWEGGSDSFKSGVKREVAASRLKGGLVTAQKRSQQKVVTQPSAGERTKGVKR